MFTWGISEHPSFQQEEGSFSIQTQSERYSSFSREQNWTVLLLRRMWREKTEWERAGRNCTTVAESNRFRQREREVVPECGEISLSLNILSVGEESACNARDLGLIPGLGRSPREGKSYPLQYPGLENSRDCIIHGVTKSRTRLSDFHFTWIYLIKTINERIQWPRIFFAWNEWTWRALC